MNALIEREFDFQAAVYFEGQFLINQYDFDILMEVNTDSIYEQNIAMERLKYLIYECFENSVFVSLKETNIIEKYTNAGLKVCITPDDPFDQIISLLILLKTSSVCESKIKILSIKLTSNLSDNVKFIENYETAINAISVDGWWNNNLPSLCSTSQSKKGKIVKLVKDAWSDLGLGWKEKKSKSTEVVLKSIPTKQPE